jgi:hypothetical protein
MQEDGGVPTMLDTEDEAYPPSMSMSIDENENDNTSKQPSSRILLDMKLIHMHEMQSNNGFENTSVNSMKLKLKQSR